MNKYSLAKTLTELYDFTFPQAIDIVDEYERQGKYAYLCELVNVKLHVVK